MSPLALAQLAKLVRRYGFRMSNLDAGRAGVPESVLFDAARTGRAKIERVHVTGSTHLVTTYVVFA